MSLHMTRFLGRHTLPAEHNRLVQGMLMGAAPGGSDCLSLSALSASVTQSVYRYLLHLTLNLVTSPVFLIFTDRASFLRAVSKKSLISLICFGCTTPQVELHQHFQLPAHRSSGYFVALLSSVRPTVQHRPISKRSSQQLKVAGFALLHFQQRLHPSVWGNLSLHTKQSSST